MRARNIQAGLLSLLLLGVGLSALFLLPRYIASHRQAAHGQRVVSGAQAFPVTVEDVMQQRTTIQHQPQRIISIAPNVTETLYAIGAGDRLIADTTYCDYPPAAAKLPKIGGYLDPNVEKIAAMKPDLVLAARGTRKELLQRLATLKIPLVVVDANTFPEVSDMIRLLGQVTGEREKAAQIADDFDARSHAIGERTKDLPAAKRPTTLLLFTLDALFSAGHGSHIDAMIQLSGGRNIAANTNTAWPQLSMESVVAADPQVILLVGMGGKDAITPEKALSILRAKSQWRGISAVKTGRLAILDTDEMTLPGPRMINGLQGVAHAIHPELFPQEAK